MKDAAKQVKKENEELKDAKVEKRTREKVILQILISS